MKVISNKAKLRNAMNSNVPRSTDREVVADQELPILREKPICKWVGRYLVKEKDINIFALENGDRL